jgi:hypothetical protein
MKHSAEFHNAKIQRNNKPEKDTTIMVAFKRGRLKKILQSGNIGRK